MKLVALVIAVIVSLAPAVLRAQNVALVIGNSEYTAVPVLDNPRNDAVAVTEALRKQGFEVMQRLDLDRFEMRDALREFRTMADGAEVALVYYSGHGIEISGTNFLIPVDARLEDERDAGLEMVQADQVLRQISGARTLKMMVLDACRNNPFVTKMKRDNAGRNIGNGLGRMDYAEADTLIAYAAAAGGITPDGVPGGNSPFTSAFLKAMSGPPTDVRRLLGRVRDDMRVSVPGAAPFVYTSLGGDELVINPRSPGAVPAPAPAAVAPALVSGRSISADFVRIDRTGTLQDWNEFLVRYEGQSDHPLYAFALEKRESLKVVTAERALTLQSQPQTLVAAPPKPEDVPVAPVPAPGLNRDQAARRVQTLLAERACYRGAVDGILGRGSARGLSAFGKEIGQSLSIGRTSDATDLTQIIAVLEQHPDVSCPAVQVVRQAPAETRPSSSNVSPKPAPKQAETNEGLVKVQGSSNLYIRPNGSKPLPNYPSDCVGNRRELFDCN